MRSGGPRIETAQRLVDSDLHRLYRRHALRVQAGDPRAQGSGAARTVAGAGAVSPGLELDPGQLARLRRERLRLRRLVEAHLPGRSRVAHGRRLRPRVQHLQPADEHRDDRVAVAMEGLYPDGP